MKFRVIVLAAIALMVLITGAYAGDKPLSLDVSIPIAGAVDVPRDSAIVLIFTNNVVNFSVADANEACFSLVTSGRDAVDARVLMADDQIEPDKKRVVTLVPSAPLMPDTEYVLTVSGKLQAKNGLTLGNDLSIGFTTTR